MFDKLKSMVGVGSPTLDLDLDPPVFVCGEPIVGSLLVSAQERPTPVKRITIRLACDITTSRPDGTTTSRRVALGETVMPFEGDGLRFAAHAKRRFPFELLPDASEDVPNAVYRLIATADCPGLDPTTTLVVARHERAAQPAAPAIAPLCVDGLLAIRSIFVPEIMRHAGDTTLLVPRFEQAAYEPSQVFRKPDIDATLLAALCGRVVFVEAFTASFGVLVAAPDSDEFAVLSVARDCTGASFCSASDIRQISVARFVGEVGQPLTYLDLYEGQRHASAAIDLDTFKGHIAELRTAYPDAVL